MAAPGSWWALKMLRHSITSLLQDESLLPREDEAFPGNSRTPEIVPILDYTLTTKRRFTAPGKRMAVPGSWRAPEIASIPNYTLTTQRILTAKGKCKSFPRS